MAKYTEKQIAELFIQSLEDAKETAKKNKELSQEIKQNLSDFHQTFFTKLNKADLKLDDTQAKETIRFFNKVSKNAQKGVNLTYFSYNLLLISIIVLGISFYIFYLNMKSKEEIREEYKQELTEKGQYNTKENAIYLEKFRYWIKKNPKDSQALNNSIEKYWEKK